MADPATNVLTIEPKFTSANLERSECQAVARQENVFIYFCERASNRSPCGVRIDSG